MMKCSSLEQRRIARWRTPAIGLPLRLGVSVLLALACAACGVPADGPRDEAIGQQLDGDMVLLPNRVDASGIVLLQPLWTWEPPHAAWEVLDVSPSRIVEAELTSPMDGDWGPTPGAHFRTVDTRLGRDRLFATGGVLTVCCRRRQGSFSGPIRHPLGFPLSSIPRTQ